MPSGGYLEVESLHIKGSLSAETTVLSAGSVDDDAVLAGQNISADKFQRKFSLHYYQQPGSAIVAATIDAHIARASGTVVAVEAAVTGALADDVSRTVTIDVQKSTGGAAFATILTSPIVHNSVSTLRVLKAAVVNNGDFIDGDLLRFVITVAGGSGNQAQGLIVTATAKENAL